MKKYWLVVLDKRGAKFDFRTDFFPRRFYYKRDAQALVDEVKEKGGQAHIEKEV